LCVLLDDGPAWPKHVGGILIILYGAGLCSVELHTQMYNV